MNMQRIIEAIIRDEIPEGYTKRDLGDGTFVFEHIEQKRESHGKTLGEILNEAIGRRDTPHHDDNVDSLDAFRQTIRDIIERHTGVDPSNLASDAQRQHDEVMREQHQKQQELEFMFERILKQKTFDLGNAHMCDLPRSVLKVLKMLLNGAGEAAEMGDTREFDTQIDAFNGLMLASGVKINCL